MHMSYVSDQPIAPSQASRKSGHQVSSMFPFATYPHLNCCWILRSSSHHCEGPRSNCYLEHQVYILQPSNSPITNNTLKTAEPTIVPKPTSFCAFWIGKSKCCVLTKNGPHWRVDWFKHFLARLQNPLVRAQESVQKRYNSCSNYWCEELRCGSTRCHPCCLQRKGTLHVCMLRVSGRYAVRP